jgi:hypothetical protein
MGFQPNTADIIANILQGSTNVEQNIVRVNSLDQMAAPASAVTFTNISGAQKLTHLSPAIVSDGAPTVGQLAGNQYAYVVSGCIWSAHNVGVDTTATMTAGTVMIQGILLTVAAVSSPRTFLASNDTYVDLTDHGDGTALINYTTVTNNSTSPALVSSGTMYNTCRIAIVAAGSSIATASSINQGAPSGFAAAVAFGSSTVAAGSNGQALNALTSSQLAVASGASFSTGGGWAQIARTSAPIQTATIQYTGVSGNNLTGITTALSGTPTGTVTTGDVVTQVFPSIGVTDTLGNLIFPTSPYPGIIGFAFFNSPAFTSTSTAGIPVPNLIAPFIVPTGIAKKVRVSVYCPFVTSSASAGSTVVLQSLIGNAVSGGSLWGYSQTKTAVASAGSSVAMAGLSGFGNSGLEQPGSYTAQVSATQNAAGTMTLGINLASTYVMVELV